jgi:exonuclease VII small subunit
MTLDDARESLISGIDYAAYCETAFSLHDSKKNVLFGSDHYKSGRPIYQPSPWTEVNFEEKMATLLVLAKVLNQSDSSFAEALRLLQNEDSILGQVIRRANDQR